MPFRRRVPLSWKERLHDYVWPRIGLRRVLRLYGYRLHRLPGTPASIAAGFGIGVGIAVNPFIGTHIILGAIVARLTGTSILAAVIGTFVINPWTAPPIWFATYYVGRKIEGHHHAAHMPGFIPMFERMADSLWSLDWKVFVETAWPVFRPMLLGSFPVGILVGLVAFAMIKPALTKLHVGRIPKKKPSPPPVDESTDAPH